MADLDYDVVIVGAGISGINFAYRLQESNPHLRYCILEARSEIGGTWSLFKYPGLRSDSDLYTFGFPWKPWKSKDTIAQGHLILDYLQEAAREHAIDRHIKFNHRVTTLNFDTTTKLWSFGYETPSDKVVPIRSRFALIGTGYYDYDTPLQATIPGIENFQGHVVHPQFWPHDLEYENKNMVIIGSGATAVTIVPSVANKVAHVTMLQRSPSYIVSVPRNGVFERVVKAILPARLSYAMIRLGWMLRMYLVIKFSKAWPGLARRALLRHMKGELPPEVALDPDFTPRYNPWDQRICLCPDGDFFSAIRSGRASVQTGNIETISSTTIKLTSGEELVPDIIVTATGLKLALLGKAMLLVDNQPVHAPDRYVWKGSMLEGVPNLFLAFGYVDASWTLGADAAAQLACRIISELGRSGKTSICPQQTKHDIQNMQSQPFMRLQSTYVKLGQSVIPKAGDRKQWRPKQLYWKDIRDSWWGDIRSSAVWS